jgi:hypothetical protein
VKELLQNFALVSSEPLRCQSTHVSLDNLLSQPHDINVEFIPSHDALPSSDKAQSSLPAAKRHGRFGSDRVDISVPFRLCFRDAFTTLSREMMLGQPCEILTVAVT